MSLLVFYEAIKFKLSLRLKYNGVAIGDAIDH